MNNKQRKQVSDCLAELEKVQQQLQLERDAENTDYQSLSDDIKNDDVGNDMEMIIGYLDDALEGVRNTINELRKPLFGVNPEMAVVKPSTEEPIKELESSKRLSQTALVIIVIFVFILLATIFFQSIIGILFCVICFLAFVKEAFH